MNLPEGLKAKTIDLVWNRHLDLYIEEHLGRAWSLQQNAFYGQETLVTFEVWKNPEATATVEAWLASPPADFVGRVSYFEDVLVNEAREAIGQPPHPLIEKPHEESVEIYTADILNELCNRDLLPEGDLMVHVWW